MTLIHGTPLNTPPDTQLFSLWRAREEQKRVRNGYHLKAYDRSLLVVRRRNVNHVWSVRVRTEARQEFTVLARNHAFRVGPALTFDSQDRLPSALEQFVGALACDLLSTFQTFARRRRVRIDALECTLEFGLDNPLIHLDVVGEEGSPRIQRIEGAVYVSSDAEPDRLHEVWQETLLRSPLYTTLERATEMSLRLVPTF
jgi:hypothetical protein